MKQIILRSILLGVVSIGTISCFEEEEEVLVNLCDYDGISAAAEAFANATYAYSQNPTYSNCNKVKSTGQTYHNKLKACPETSSSDLSGVEDLIDNLDCSIHL